MAEADPTRPVRVAIEMSHLFTKEFIRYALDAAVDSAVEKAWVSTYPEQKRKHIDDMKSLRRCIEVIESLPEADILCAPELDWES